jgi:threonine/homoserine/homoserine lactone efflux protein
MEALLAFTLAFFFSFVGSIPPATINLTVVQLGLDHKLKIAYRLSLAAALIEYPYAWIAIKFEDLITNAPMVTQHFQLITAIVMLAFGLLSILSSNKPSKLSEKITNSGFRRGIMLGILNPLAMPFWIAVVAYLKGQHWLDVSTMTRVQSFLLGVSSGAFVLLILIAYLAKKIASEFQQSIWLKRIPGIVMLCLGIYALTNYFFIVKLN